MKYFLHDTSAFDDEKVAELYIKYGYEGVGLFYVLLEKLGKQEKPIKTVVLKSQLGVGKKLEKCWDFMEEIGLISSNNGETFNKQLLNYSESYKIKKQKTREKVSDWRKNQAVEENVTSYKDESNPPKVKVSKGNIDNSISNSKSVSIVDRKLKFASSLENYLGTYGKDLLNDFYKYWTEPNKSNTKFRQELEKTWDLGRRLETWAKRDKTFTNGTHQQPSNNLGKSAGFSRLVELTKPINSNGTTNH